ALLVEELEADVAAAEQVLLGERDPRLGGLRVLHLDARAARAELVRDPRRAERLRDLAALRGLDTARDRHVARLGRVGEEEDRGGDERDRGADERDLAARLEVPPDVLELGQRHGL